MPELFRYMTIDQHNLVVHIYLLFASTLNFENCFGGGAKFNHALEMVPTSG